MLPRARPRRRFGWPFGRRSNRRVAARSGDERTRSSRAASAAAAGAAALRRSARLTLGVGLLLCSGGGALAAHRFLMRSPHFAVAAVRFSPLVHVSAESLGARAGVALGTPLFRVDLDAVAHAVAEEPWVESARARRELPSTVVVDVVERQAACLVALGPLYLADARGVVFKRASPDEAAALPVVTGVAREAYLSDPERALASVREALAALAAWRRGGARPPVGEVHCDPPFGLTLYSAGGTGVRVGRVDGELDARLGRFDAVWEALQARGERARLIYLDNRARPDRVTVKLAPSDGKNKSDT
jgi:cell division protein FtsQ